MKIIYTGILLIFIIGQHICGQHSFDFNGQLSWHAGYHPENEMEVITGGRYLPGAEYSYSLNNHRTLNFEAAANIYGTVLMHPFDSSDIDGNIRPYRLWARYLGKQFELRLGLQKINFGSATLLRPLQWFDEVDPRDPLKFTNGVYGLLGRYYFMNNANIWAWVLYGNEEPRGFELLKNNTRFPEFGGRVQHPVPRGELAATYHHRTVDSGEIPLFSYYRRIPENKFGLDGKWDIIIGIWFEMSHIHKAKNLGVMTNQSFLNAGADYTFGVGNGLNVVIEHLVMAMGDQKYALSEHFNVSASIVSYPIGFFDQISTISYYSWDSKDFSFFINYEHQFKKFTGYVMTYYIPGGQLNYTGNQFSNMFTGPGVRLMLVYNH